MKKIYLIRHGQTDYNLRNIVQGSGVDASLNERGQRQAAAFYEHYQHLPLDRIYTSTLKRTAESVQPFVAQGIPVMALEGLNEISWGNQEGQIVTPEENAYYHEMLRIWQSGDTSRRIEGGESPEDVARRLKPALQHIMAQQEEQNILVCMHGRAMRILLCLMLNYPLRSMDMFEHRNLTLYEVWFTGTMFRLNRYNDTTHLTLLS